MRQERLASVSSPEDSNSLETILERTGRSAITAVVMTELLTRSEAAAAVDAVETEAETEVEEPAE